MKKTLFMAAAVVMTLAACSNDEDAIKVNKGMTLIANVENTDTRATIEKVGESKEWKFIWENGDAVSVTSPSETPYIFTYDGTKFSCETAESAEGTWTAVYPAALSDSFNFLNQDGTLANVMKNYYMTAECESDGSAQLQMTMEPKFAILKVTNENDETVYIHYLKSEATFLYFANSYYVSYNYSSQKADINTKGAEYAGEIFKGETKYYIAPAGFEFKLQYRYGGSDKTINLTEFKTLTAGHIYNVTF